MSDLTPSPSAGQPAISAAQRKQLKAQAHSLQPVAFVGKAGISPELTATVSDELDRHTLIKVRITEGKERRKEIAAELALATNSILVALVGNVVTLYRESTAKR